jgi:hypothetical protein
VRRLRFAILLVCVSVVFTGCAGVSSSGSNNSPGGGSLGGGTPGDPPVLPAGANFFSLNINKLSDPWPTQLGVNFGVWRTLGADLIWSQLEPCQPADETDVNDTCYSWNTSPQFDDFLQKAMSNGQQVMYTAYYTPTWASQDPTDSCSKNLGMGGCRPPVDVESGDQHWKNFLAALYTHVHNQGGHIKYWECWNEVDVTHEYNGSMADLNTICKDLHDTIHSLDATAQFTTPSTTGVQGPNSFMGQWVRNGYAQEADIVAFHGYVCGPGILQCPFAETVVPIVQSVQSALAGTTAASLPMWDTEGGYPGYNLNGQQPPADMHAAFVARYLLLQQSASVAMVSYFGWDYDNIALINDPGSQAATPNLAGVAWQQIYKWTVGAKYTSACQNTSGSIWQCGLTLNGTSYLIAWDTSQTCNSGQCTTSSATVPSGFTQFDDLSGNTDQPISDGKVQVGAKPIRLH